MISNFKKTDFLQFFLLALLISTQALAQDAEKSRKVKTDGLKDKYWALGKSENVGVVQNRMYTKASKVEFSLLGGVLSADPFLDTKAFGASLGYHFNEYFSANALYLSYTTRPSLASDKLKEKGAYANTSVAKSFMGGDLAFSPIYGKLSVLGSLIIYYDAHAMLGGGIVTNADGLSSTAAFYAGIGQQIYITKLISLRLDWRIMNYSERLIERTPGNENQGKVAGTISPFNQLLTVGVSFLLGPLR